MGFPRRMEQRAIRRDIMFLFFFFGEERRRRRILRKVYVGSRVMASRDSNVESRSLLLYSGLPLL